MKLTIIALKVNFEGKNYSLNNFFGFLYSKPGIVNEVVNYSEKTQKTISYIDFPYTLQHAPNKKIKSNFFLKFLAGCISLFVKINFRTGIFISRLRVNQFDNSNEAVLFYRQNYKQHKQGDLCLSRCFFAVSSSKSFKQKGTMVIGAHLPTNSLHSWIIEDGTNVDPHDHLWINYQPIALILFE